MRNDSRILIAGGKGLVGSAVVRHLADHGYTNVIPFTRGDADLTDQAATLAAFQRLQPEYVVVAAAKVGGIYANSTFPADFLYDNLMIQNNIIHSAWKTGVVKLLFLGSSCIYPKLAPQPIREEHLLTSELEPTNEAYAVAKIAGLKLCNAYYHQHGCSFFSAMPCNIYGIGDNFHPENSHVIPGLIRRFHEAKLAGQSSVTCWGSGSPKREFLFADDLASALLFLLNNFDGPGFLNVGTEHEITVAELANLVKQVVGYRGEIVWDTSKPDGTPRKVMDCSKLRELGWMPKTRLEEGLRLSYAWFLDNVDTLRG